MPMYEYRCTKCGAEFEQIQKFSDPPVKKCRTCPGTVEKLISRSAFQLKGTGWYVTDYARKSPGGGSSGSGSSGGGSKGSDSGGGSSAGSGGSGGSESGGGGSGSESGSAKKQEPAGGAAGSGGKKDSPAKKGKSD